jgi:hypothetical protein
MKDIVTDGRSEGALGAANGTCWHLLSLLISAAADALGPARLEMWLPLRDCWSRGSNAPLLTASRSRSHHRKMDWRSCRIGTRDHTNDSKWQGFCLKSRSKTGIPLTCTKYLMKALCRYHGVGRETPTQAEIWGASVSAGCLFTTKY